MDRQAQALKNRTKLFAWHIIRGVRSRPPGQQGSIISHQLLPSGTSVAAHHRTVCRARSRPEFLARPAIVREEADESAFWRDLPADAGLIPAPKLSSPNFKDLKAEAKQREAIFIASRPIAKQRVQSAITNSGKGVS
jgi:four helix bundle protein